MALYYVTDNVLLLFYDINLFIKGVQMYVYIYDAKDALTPMNFFARLRISASHLRSMRNYRQENVKTDKKMKTWYDLRDTYTQLYVA